MTIIEGCYRYCPSRRMNAIRFITSTLQNEGTQAKLSWMPAHSGIEDNQLANTLARLILTSRASQSECQHISKIMATPFPEMDQDGEDQDYDPAKANVTDKQEFQQALRAAPVLCPCPIATRVGWQDTVHTRKIVTTSTANPVRKAQLAQKKITDDTDQRNGSFGNALNCKK